MKHRTHRLRRLAAAVALGVGMVGSMIGVAASTAGAAVVKNGSFTASNPTTITHGPSVNQKVGTMLTTINTAFGATPPTATDVWAVKITAKALRTVTHPTTPSGIVTFTTKGTDTSGGIAFTACKLTAGALVCYGITKTHTGHLTVSGARATSTTGKGHMVAFAVLGETTALGTGFTAEATHTLTPASGTIANYTATTPTTPGFNAFNITTRPIPPVGVGATGASAGTWVVLLTGGVGAGVTKGETVSFVVTPHTKVLNTCLGTTAVAFDGKPTVVVTTTTTVHTTTAPTVGTVTLSGTGTGCSTKFAPNTVTFTFTNTVKFNHAGGQIAIAVTAVKYSDAFKTATNTVRVVASFKKGTTALATVGPSSATANAIISKAYVTANTPTKVVGPKAFDATISPVKVVEAVAGTVPKGYVCVTLNTSLTGTSGSLGNTSTEGFHSTGFTFNSASKPAVKVTGGTGKASTAHRVNNTTVAFKVTAASTGTPSTYVLSGLAVNSTRTQATLKPVVRVYYDANKTCTAAASGKPTDHIAVAFNTSRVTVIIYGATADATAVQELEHVFHATVGACPLAPTGHRTVVLSRDTGFPDALASQYLASYLGTGTLLTPKTSLAAVTKNALEFEGVTTVFVTGGPLAITTTVVGQIETIPVFKCGGKALTTTATGSERFIHVVRIAGPTAYATAKTIDEHVPLTHVGSMNVSAAYGKYNDTIGTSSKAPKLSGTLRTAILATGKVFQDALSSSALAYHTNIPIVLTTTLSLSPQARATLQDLSIQQVIVMGGQLAITNTVVKTLTTTLNLSALRIAGADGTDTAQELANFELREGPTTHAGRDWNGTTILVSRGNGFTDALAGAVLEHTGEFPSLLTESPTVVGTYLTKFLKAVGPGGPGYETTSTPPEHEHITFMIILGGPLAVSPTVITQMRTDLHS